MYRYRLLHQHPWPQDRADLTAADRQGNGVLAVVPASGVELRWVQDGGCKKNAWSDREDAVVRCFR